MNDEKAISVESVTKFYQLYNSAHDRLKEALNPFKKKYHNTFYAVKDVSFDVGKGEKVGIIGTNGAGKSTLLKMITGVLTPSEGNIVVNGKVASLLELGAGFNPELSGVDNIYLNGTLMGFTRIEMDNKFADIVRFADIGEFIHQPAKKYSSGMFARLAFSVAINVEPDVLIIDEALSVGDMAFQAKCMAKMKEMTDRGVTLLFVSHDISSIQSLCDRAVFIDNGSIVKIGDVDSVTSLYMEIQREKNNEYVSKVKSTSVGNIQEVTEPSSLVTVSNCNIDKFDLDLTGDKILTGKLSGNMKCTILDYKLLDHNGIESDEFISNEKYSIQLAIKFNEDLDSFCIVSPIRSLNGVQEIGVSTAVEKFTFPSVKKDDIYIVEIESIMNIQYGIYNLVLSIEIPIESNVIHEFAYILENCKTFKVVWDELKFPMKFYTSGEISYEKIS